MVFLLQVLFYIFFYIIILMLDNLNTLLKSIINSFKHFIPMKNKITLMLLFCSFISFCQGEKFELTSEKNELINQYVVIQKDSMSINDGYNKVLEWVNITYNTPKEVIKSQLENEYVRIEGFSENFTSQNILGVKYSYNGKYSITFEFKPNKIKMELTRIQIYSDRTQYSAGGWSDQYPTYEMQYRKNGKLKKQIAGYVQGMVNNIDLLRMNFQQYLFNENKSVVKKDDW